MYEDESGRDLFADLVEAERKEGIRVVAENEFAIAFVPFFARYAYEVMVFPKQRHASLATLSEEELKGLAEVYHAVIKGYDALFNMAFPYTMIIQQAPFNAQYAGKYWVHLQFSPPLRKPNLQKILGGPESGADTFMADTMPEEKAQELKAAIAR